jgi:hypothetical protein
LRLAIGHDEIAITLDKWSLPICTHVKPMVVLPRGPIGVHRVLEDDSLVVTFALSFGLDAVFADWALFTALYAAASTC